MLMVQNYADPLSGRGRASPFADKVGQMISVYTASGAPPFCGVLLRADPQALTLVCPNGSRSRSPAFLCVAADKITAVRTRR